MLRPKLLTLLPCLLLPPQERHMPAAVQSKVRRYYVQVWAPHAGERFARIFFSNIQCVQVHHSMKAGSHPPRLHPLAVLHAGINDDELFSDLPIELRWGLKAASLGSGLTMAWSGPVASDA